MSEDLQTQDNDTARRYLMEEEVEVEEHICRYCFDDESAGELISPCECKGDQKYVHVECLHRWQRMILVQQPTHPTFYKGDDQRHHVCSVCKSVFTCPPPTRHDLMSSFTGPEIASLIQPGCVIGAHHAFSEELCRQHDLQPRGFDLVTGYKHWIHGVYLITEATAEDGRLELSFSSPGELEELLYKLGPAMRIKGRGGKNYVPVPGGALEDVAPEDCAEALRRLETKPGQCMRLYLGSTEPATTGDDRITAIGLHRRVAEATTSEGRHLVDRSVAIACGRHKKARQVELEHYLGGPCDQSTIMGCVVPGGTGKGWTLVHPKLGTDGVPDRTKQLAEAIVLAYSRSLRRYEEQGGIGGGETVLLKGLKNRPDLNGEVGLTLRFKPENGRYRMNECHLLHSLS